MSRAKVLDVASVRPGIGMSALAAELLVGLTRRLMAGLDPAELASLRDALAALDREARHLRPSHSDNVTHPERTPA